MTARHWLALLAINLAILAIGQAVGIAEITRRLSPVEYAICGVGLFMAGWALGKRLRKLVDRTINVRD